MITKKRAYIIVVAILVAAAAIGLWSLQRKQLPDQSAIKGIQTKAPVYVDVRTAQEWEQGHVDGALNFDLARLQQGELPDLPKDAKIILYCHSGRRAGLAEQILERSGYTDVTNAGGIAGLQAQGIKTCAGTRVACN